jgi:ferredoxin
MGTVRIVIDLDRCMGTGVCILAAPKVFDQSAEDGRVFVLENVETEQHLAAIREAVAACPSRALSLAERE